MQRIPLSQLEQMFRSMRTETRMDVDGPLLWGYFFMDPNPDKLRRAATELEAAGYRVANVYPADDGSTHVLHVERTEHHTPASLHARNTELYRLAEKHGLNSYDGMDVGPPEPSAQAKVPPRHWWKFW